LTFHHPLFNNQLYQVLRIDLTGLREEYTRRAHPLLQLVFG